MGLIICYSCGRQRTVKPIRNRKALVCSNCGARQPRVVDNVITKMRMADTSDKDGLELHEARAQTLAGLKWVAEQKGYKPGWASFKFKAIYGSWPNGESNVEPAGPQAGLLEWIKRQNVPYKKMMREREAKGLATPRKPNPETRTVRAEGPTLMSAEDESTDWR